MEVVEGEDEELDSAINDKVNDAYGFVYALAMFVGPLVGGVMADSVGERATSDYFAIMNIGLGILLFVCNCGPFVFGEHKSFNAKLNELKEKAEKLQLAQTMAAGDDNTSINDIGVPFKGMQMRMQSKSLIRPKVGALNMLDSNTMRN